jgi:hypothetical protein
MTKCQHYKNENGQTVALDKAGTNWRVYNPEQDTFGPFAKGPPIEVLPLRRALTLRRRLLQYRRRALFAGR